MNCLRYLAAVLLVAASACSSHGSTVLPQSSSGSTPVSPSSKGTSAKLSIQVPRPSSGTASTRRQPKYVSPSTTQLVVAVGNGTSTSYGLTSASPGCTTQVTTLNCVFTVAAPAGQDTFTLTLEDAAGNALSKNTVSAQLTAGQSTPVNVTLAGIPAAVQLVPGGVVGVDGTGNPSWHFPGLWPHPIEAETLDADNNVIIGPGAPKITQVSVSAGSAFAKVASAGTTDPAAFILTPTGVSAAGQTVTVSATVQGVTLNDGTTLAPITTSTTFTYTPAIAIIGGPEIAMYSVETGNLVARWGLPAGGGGTTAIAIDPTDGTLYVASILFAGLSPSSIVFEFPAGSAIPSAALSAKNGIGRVKAIAVDKNGMLYVANQKPALSHFATNIVEFPKGATTPSVTITGGVAVPSGLGVDGSGNVYLVDSGSIEIYGPGAQTAPSKRITDPTLIQPEGIAVDSAGDFYVSDTNTGNPQIAYFSSGSTSTTNSLTDPTLANWNSLGALTLDPSGNLWTSLYSTTQIERFDASSLPNSVSIGNTIATEIPASGLTWIP